MPQEYDRSAWKALGRAVAEARSAERMTRPAFATAIRSSSKSVLRLEAGNVHGDLNTRPAGDYNSENYWIKRLPLLEMVLGWHRDHALSILNEADCPDCHQARTLLAQADPPTAAIPAKENPCTPTPPTPSCSTRESRSTSTRKRTR